MVSWTCKCDSAMNFNNIIKGHSFKYNVSHFLFQPNLHTYQPIYFYKASIFFFIRHSSVLLSVLSLPLKFLSSSLSLLQPPFHPSSPKSLFHHSSQPFCNLISPQRDPLSLEGDIRLEILYTLCSVNY